MDSKLLLIQAAAKKVADTAHPASVFLNESLDKKLDTFKEGIKSTDPHQFTRNYITLGSKVFGSKTGLSNTKPTHIMKNLYGIPLVNQISRLTKSVETGWTKGKELHYQSFEEGALAAYVTLVREMYELKDQFVKKKLLTLSSEENRVYDSIFNSNYLKMIADLINKSKTNTQESIVKEFTTPGFDTRTDFISEMIFRKFRNNASGYAKLIAAIKKVSAIAKPLYSTASSLHKDAGGFT